MKYSDCFFLVGGGLVVVGGLSFLYSLIWPNLIEEAKPADITGMAQLQLGYALAVLQAFLPAMISQGFRDFMNNPG